jgi:hypothetical protein
MAQLLLHCLWAGQLLSADNVRFPSELHFDRCALDGFVTHRFALRLSLLKSNGAVKRFKTS